MTRRKKLAAAGAAALVLGITACGSYGESHDHNAPPPAYDIRATWVRIQSPGNYHTIIFTCVLRDGIYIDQADSNSVTATANDPNCGPAGQILTGPSSK